MWHFTAEEDPLDPETFNSLTEFNKERRKVVALCLVQDNIDYSLLHYIVEADTPKRAWDTLKEVFIEEPTIEEDDFVSQEKHQESHTEVEDSQDECVYEAGSDHVIQAKTVDLFVFVDDNENEPPNVADSLCVQDTVDSIIEATTIAENEQ